MQKRLRPGEGRSQRGEGVSGGGSDSGSLEEESGLRLVAVEGEEGSVVLGVGEERLAATPLVDGDDAGHGTAAGEGGVDVGDASGCRCIRHGNILPQERSTLHDGLSVCY